MRARVVRPPRSCRARAGDALEVAIGVVDGFKLGGGEHHGCNPGEGVEILLSTEPVQLGRAVARLRRKRTRVCVIGLAS